MKEELSIDELLNSYIDGELTARQQTEVRRLIDNDAQIARRMQHLEKCKMLMSSLPAVEPPRQISDNLKALLEAKTQPSRLRPGFEQPAVTRNLLSQRIMAVAAMIGLVVVLTVVLYSIAPTERMETIEPNPNAVADMSFRGRLELKTRDMIAVDSFIKRTIEDNGFADVLRPARESNRHIYFINCSQKGLDRLLEDMDNIWDELDSARLLVETGVFGEQVVVDAVTTEQIAKIVGQQNAMRSLNVAKDYAALNSTAQNLPGRDIYSAIEDRMGGLMTIKKPYLTKKTIDKPQIREEGEKTVHLTITVSR